MAPESDIAIGALEATIRFVRLPMGLVLDYVWISGDACTIQTDPVGLTVKEPARVEVGIGAKSLEALLDRMAPAGLENFKIRFERGKLVVEAVKRVLVALPARATCSLRVVDETKLFVDVEEVQMLGAGVQELVQAQMAQFNPVLDLASLPLNVSISEVVVESNGIVMRGTAAPKD